jgi:hypothetical protein
MLRATLVLLIGACALSAQPPLERILFLLGNWASDTDTELGHATALSTFAQELDRRILTRRGSTKYTSGKNAGQQHDDLLIVYPEGPNGGMKAIYFDAEGHVIHYTGTDPHRWAQTAGVRAEGPLPLAIFARRKPPRIGSRAKRSARRLCASSSPNSATSRRSRC